MVTEICADDVSSKITVHHRPKDSYRCPLILRHSLIPGTKFFFEVLSAWNSTWPRGLVRWPHSGCVNLEIPTITKRDLDDSTRIVAQQNVWHRAPVREKG